MLVPPAKEAVKELVPPTRSSPPRRRGPRPAPGLEEGGKGPKFWIPASAQGCPRKFLLQTGCVPGSQETISILLRGLDPRIHVFASTVSRRGWAGQHQPNRGWKTNA